MLTRDEELRIANYLKDYATYLFAKADKEYSAVVQLMIRGAVADINQLVERLRYDSEEN